MSVERPSIGLSVYHKMDSERFSWENLFTPLNLFVSDKYLWTNMDTGLSFALVMGALITIIVIWGLISATGCIGRCIGEVLFIWASMGAFFVVWPAILFVLPFDNYLQLISNVTEIYVGLRDMVG